MSDLLKIIILGLLINTVPITTANASTMVSGKSSTKVTYGKWKRYSIGYFASQCQRWVYHNGKAYKIQTKTVFKLWPC